VLRLFIPRYYLFIKLQTLNFIVTVTTPKRHRLYYIVHLSVYLFISRFCFNLTVSFCPIFFCSSCWVKVIAHPALLCCYWLLFVLRSLYISAVEFVALRLLNRSFRFCGSSWLLTWKQSVMFVEKGVYYVFLKLFFVFFWRVGVFILSLLLVRWLFRWQFGQGVIFTYLCDTYLYVALLTTQTIAVLFSVLRFLLHASTLCGLPSLCFICLVVLASSAYSQ
jgi:hypothetical protein